ncbi:hypothetical protein B0T19DRAFT_398026 [Cercophora scortea]|uniref:Uncharacterized protein n=1 Tax=Cercophora scortea TaxID=314031 RepID=A0AAE0IWH5_9PEZI|nr:hypothetical protein B0T19DRAFT_398026 [Cercophora scortea]
MSWRRRAGKCLRQGLVLDTPRRHHKRSPVLVKKRGSKRGGGGDEQEGSTVQFLGLLPFVPSQAARDAGRTQNGGQSCSLGADGRIDGRIHRACYSQLLDAATPVRQSPSSVKEKYHVLQCSSVIECKYGLLVREVNFLSMASNSDPWPESHGRDTQALKGSLEVALGSMEEIHRPEQEQRPLFPSFRPQQRSTQVETTQAPAGPNAVDVAVD